MAKKVWQFGIMSSVWECKAKNRYCACMAMIMYLGANVPLAIYTGKGGVVHPLQFLEAKGNENRAKAEKHGIQEAYKTIVKIK